MYIDRKVSYSIREQGKDYNTGEKRLHQETKAEKNNQKQQKKDIKTLQFHCKPAEENL